MSTLRTDNSRPAPGAFDATDPLLPDTFLLHAKWRGPKEAVICGEDRVSWAELGARICRTANGLLDLGIQPGDRVGIVMSNGLPMLEALLGTMLAGGVSVPINLSVPDDAISSMLEDASISALVITPDQKPRLERLRLDSLIRIIAGPDQGDWVGMDGFKTCSATRPDVTIGPDHGLNIIYSSGTTGLPKGIYHTHATRRDWACDLGVALRYNGAARGLVSIGMYSNISWVTMLCTLLAGGTLIIDERFDAARFLELVERERITHTSMVPVMFQRVIEAMERAACDVSSMQAMMSCGSPLHEGLKKQIFKHFRCGVIELYGLTEGVITTLEPEEADGRWASVGRPLQGTDLRLIDEDDREAAPGEPGEIVARGRITMPGYWGRADANEEATWRDAEGRAWFRTGDIGQIDEDGYLYIVDRKKDMILSGGQNIYPQ
ncbi:MAG: class I adenylate-forming enzyme family protein, partial [Alphaproteobacteria bacterium]|nr:class I adenylate-forming enzyme family protein [Alphaproteobacteria bacterium]